jgi:hypothetical protein
MLTKTDTYYCDKDAVTEVLKTSMKGGKFGGNKYDQTTSHKYSGNEYDGSKISGRNLRSVWTISPQGYKGQHFAAFGPALIEPMIRVACPEFVCPECGAPFARVVVEDTLERYELDPSDPNYRPHRYKTKYEEMKDGGTGQRFRQIETRGFWATCEHDLDPIPGMVYDPFMGSGTVGLVANYLGRRWVGTDLGWDYLLQAKERSGINAAQQFYKELEEWKNGIDARQSRIDDLPMFSALKEN